jgi:hypothetical protein
VIVRIATEGQYELPDADVPALNELDNAAVSACGTGDEKHFTATYAKLIELVRTKGNKLPDDVLEPSDVILPPPDVTLAEAAEEFSGEGLIPG